MDHETLKSMLQAGPDCPSVGVLASRMDLPAESAERRAVDAHVATCAHCRTELAMLREFESGTVRPEEKDALEWITNRLASAEARQQIRQPQDSGSKWWQRLWSPPGFAAALAVAAALIVAVNVEWRRPVIPGEGPDVVRAAPLRAISPLGDLNVAPREFRWTAVSGAAGYRLTVTEVDRTVVFNNKLTTTSTQIPDQVRKLFQPGKSMLWMVTAEDASGREIASTGFLLIRLLISESK